MKNVKAPVSDSYQDYLISRLEDLGYAALYLETHLEEEEDATPELLQLALSNVTEALSRSRMSPEKAELHRQKLAVILSCPAGSGIYELAGWLRELGLKLTVTIQDDYPKP